MRWDSELGRDERPQLSAMRTRRDVRVPRKDGSVEVARGLPWTSSSSSEMQEERAEGISVNPHELHARYDVSGISVRNDGSKLT